MWRIIKRTAIVLALLVLGLGVAGWAYVHTLNLDDEPRAKRSATAQDLAFVQSGLGESRGRVLAVITSTARIPANGKKAGYELSELSRAYWVFVANGYAVDIASPQGGEPAMVLDDDLVDADYAFLNSAQARQQRADTLRLADVDPADYQAVFFVGGKGAMFDFPGNPDVQRIVRHILPRGAVGAVCHGPAALVGLALDDGSALLSGRRVTGFTNEEELFLIPEARDVFPFLLQDALAGEAAAFVEGPLYLENTVRDGRLVTGQNPWSTWSVAEQMVRVLGHEPVPRAPNAEDISLQLLATYRAQGVAAALKSKADSPPASKHLLLMHALVAAMRGHWGDAWDLQRLARA